MSDQVGRKKSYRWVSASQASYDGSEWDSDDDGAYNRDYGNEADAKSLLKREDTISKLPALPKLDYDAPVVNEKITEKNEDKTEEEAIEELPELSGRDRTESFTGEDVLKNYMESTTTNSPQKSMSGVKPSPPVVKEEYEEPTLPNLEYASSVDSSRGSLSRRAPVNEDLDNLMAQISREMEQNDHQQQALEQESEADLDDNLNVSGEEDYGVSRNGYFTNLVESDGDNEQNEDEDRESMHTDEMAADLVGYSPESHLERSALSTSLSYSHSSKETGQGSYKDEPHEVDLPAKSHDVQEILDSPASQSQLSLPESKESSLEESENDALSYTESLDYHTSRNNHEKHLIRSQEEESDASSSESYGSAMRIHKSGYFGKMVSGTDNDILDKEGAKEEDEKEVENVVEEEDKSLQLGTLGDFKGTPEEKEPSSNQDDQVNDGPNGSRKTSTDDTGKRTISGQKSVNLGGWRPDTSAARSGFVQETAKKAPPGYVYDEEGKLVDLTPSSMKQRVVSTYSEAESAWNPFPSNTNDEVETIKDTKTLYDNQTIYNVPGLMTNNQNLPPLPNLGGQQRLANQPTGSNSSDPKSLTVGSSIATVSEIDSDKGPLQSHFKEVLSSHDLHKEAEPAKGKKESASSEDARKAIKVSGASSVPYLDLNKVISSKSSHASKIRELQRYYNQMLEHETGIEAWIEASLKTSAKPERGYLFDEYKVNKHVKDAYANADELSKKHTVSNTVASVNQNVSQLTKKVFSHPMKSRGLFASIGKKRI